MRSFSNTLFTIALLNEPNLNATISTWRVPRHLRHDPEVEHRVLVEVLHHARYPYRGGEVELHHVDLHAVSVLLGLQTLLQDKMY